MSELSRIGIGSGGTSFQNPELSSDLVREAALVSWQAWGTWWGGRTIFWSKFKGGEEIFDATLKEGEIRIRGAKWFLT